MAKAVMISAGLQHQLFEHGGTLLLTPEYGRGILRNSLHYVKRKPTTSRKLNEVEIASAAVDAAKVQGLKNI